MSKVRGGISDSRQLDSTSEKIREIKLRQQCWMKQRAAESNKFSDSRDGDTSIPPASDSSNLPSRKSSYVLRPSASTTPLTNDVSRTNRHSTTDASGPLSRTSNSYGDLSNHFCPSCSQIMVAPHHQPVLLIPCSHSVCCRCCRSRVSCPVCKCDIHSQIPNTLLEEVVSQYQRGLTATNNHFSAQQKSSAIRISAAESVEEYNDNLTLRRRVLETEQASILSAMQQFDCKAASEDKQIANIDREQQRIADQIEDLKQRLDVLTQHKHEYEARRQQHFADKANMASKLKLVQSTLAQLQLLEGE